MIWTARMGYSRFPSPPAFQPPESDEGWNDDEEDEAEAEEGDDDE